MTRRLVVFDVDGTLVDSQRLILGAMAMAFEAAGLPQPSDPETLSIVGLSLPEAMRALRPLLDETAIAALVAAYKASFNQLRLGEAAAPLYAGALAALTAMHALPDTVLGIATGKSRRGLDGLLQAHDLARFFATTQVADDHPSKPHPSMLLHAMAETGAGPGVMVGDTEFDMAMGKAAGFATIGVTWGYHGRARLRQADLVIDDFAGLQPALLRMWGV